MSKTKRLASIHLSDGSLLELTFNLSIHRICGDGYNVMFAKPNENPVITRYKSKDEAHSAYAEYIKRDVLEID